MIPDLISRSHLIRAIRAIDRDGVPARRRSTRYDVFFGERQYPPKYVVFVAYRLVKGKELWGFGGGAETNNFLIARGFDIRNKKGEPAVVQPVQEDEQREFFEGRVRYAQHRKIERDSRVSKLVKHRRLARVGDLYCDACGFSFWKNYGPRGAAFIEAHHTRPVSELGRRSAVKPSEIALVCSNCHRILHRSRPWLSIRDLRGILGKQRAARQARRWPQ